MDPNLYSSFSDDDKHQFHIWLRSHLHFGPVTVTFKKKDGTDRKMICTLKPDLVKEYEKKTDRTKSVNEETCPVFDLDKQEWRSFRYDSITRVEIVI